MNVETLRMLEHVHGHLGWLAAAALVHPAILLRNPQRRARLSVLGATLFATVAGGLGGFLYHYYSHLLRRVIYTASFKHGLLFERKEHLAFAAIALAWAGCLVHLFARGDDASSRARAVFAHRAFVGAAVLAVVVATLGTIVASFRSF